VIPYTTTDGGKECPMSLVEGLACGLPALVSAKLPFSEFVTEQKCGVVFDSTPDSLVAAIETGLRRYPELAVNAATAAGRCFSLENFLKRMEQLYSEVLN
jgi:glycosyltransferase involved in cell wall biosynthesis